MSSENRNPVDTAIFSFAHQASIETIFDFCIIVGRQLNLKEIEGVPLDEWFAKRKIERMESIRIKLEETDPPLAAKFQKVIDKSRKRTDF